MYEFLKTIDGEDVSAMFMRKGSDWYVQVNADEAKPTLDLYLNDFKDNPVTQWIHRIESSALPLIERDPESYLKVKTAMSTMLVHASDVVKNRKTLEDSGLLCYGPITQQASRARIERIMESFAEHVNNLEKFGVSGDLTNSTTKANEIIATAFVLSQEEKTNEKGGENDTGNFTKTTH